MRRVGFTLIELIVVVVVLAVVAGLAAPRLTGNDRRRALSEVDAARDMLAVVARRDALGSHRMALVWDGAGRSLRLDAMRVGASDGRRRDARAVWRPDPLVPGVDLGAVSLVEARFDGAPADDRSWRVDFVPGVPRRHVELVLEQVSGGAARRWSVTLLPYASGPAVRGPGFPSAEAPRAVDLDALGRSDVPW